MENQEIELMEENEQSSDKLKNLINKYKEQNTISHTFTSRISKWVTSPAQLMGHIYKNSLRMRIQIKFK